MNEIPLRAYNREIEEALDQKFTEEAIAHCRHILKVFPKYIDTYRLLGKAYLESRRYGNATDIFQRVLSSIPDDFVSHVGMSIIREDEGNLDAAIWHMERAFEAQPYNLAIQEELRHLYGRRDGMEPPKIRMTKGALARMYGKSDLYDQAIAEIRSNLVEDPKRADLEALLAQMYIKNGQQAEAIQVCSSLLKRLPYCLEANRYLSQIFSTGERSDEFKTYRQRLEALDPYEAHTSTRMPNAEDVPDQAVTINRLDWDGGTMISDEFDQPEWVTSIGVQLDGIDSEDHDLPDWLRDIPDRSTESRDTIDGYDSAIPEWMQEVGWGPSSGKFDESESVFDMDGKSSDRAEAIAGDIPGWLQDMVPPDALDEDLEIFRESTDLPPWLAEEADNASDTIVNWLNDKTKEPGDEPSIPSQDIADKSLPEAETSETPEWLQDLEDSIPSETGPIEETGESEIPDWLVEMEEAQGEPEIPESVSFENPAEESPVGEPDWLQDLEDKGTQEIEPVEEPGETEPLEIPDWLVGIEEIQSEPEIPEPVSFEKPAEESPVGEPDWLQDLEDKGTQEIEPAEEPGETEPLEVPDWLVEMEETQGEPEAPEPVSFEEPEIEQEDIPTEIETPEPISLIEPEEEDTDVLPDWLLEIARETPQPLEAETTEEIEPAELPDWLEEVTLETEALQQVHAVEEETTPDSGWLEEEEIDETPSVSLEDLAGDESVEIPDWLRELEVEPSTPETIQDGSEIPSKTAPVFQGEELDESLADIESGEIPGWLAKLEQPADEEDITTEAITEAIEGTRDQGELVIGDEVPLESPGEEAPQPVPDSDLQVEETESAFDFEDADAAMAWLEGLAAKQGVSEEELLTRPEDRLDTPPQWVQAEIETTRDTGYEEEMVPEDLATESKLEEITTEKVVLDGELTEGETEPISESPEWIGGLDEGEESPSTTLEIAAEDDLPTTPEEESLPQFDLDDSDAAMAWLESLAAKQGVSEEELLTSPDERSEEPPEWVKEEMAGEAEAVVPDWLRKTLDEEISLEETPEESQTEESEREELPGWLQAVYGSESLVEEETAQESEQAPSLDDRTAGGEVSQELPDFVDEQTVEPPVDEPLLVESRSEDEEDTTEEVISDQIAEPPAHLESLSPETEFDIQPPDWVLAGEEPEDKEYEWVPDQVTEEGSTVTEELDLNEASLIQLERLAPLGFRKAQAIVAYRNENGQFEDISELLSVPGIDQDTLNELQSLLFVKPPLVEETDQPVPTEVVDIPDDASHAMHLEAQADIQRGNIDNALEKYEQLIQGGQRIDLILDDLSQAIDNGLYTEKMVEVLTNLGDAFLRLDRLQSALNAYTKAEEILR